MATPKNLTLIDLPPEIIVDILSSVDTYNHLYTLITSSPVFIKPFITYQTQILTGLAQKILGDSWDDAIATLVYQRHFNSQSFLPDFKNVKKDLGTEFVLTRGDIKRLIANQRVFKSCALDWEAHISFHYPHAKAVPPKGFAVHISPSFIAGDPLPMKLFYGVWLLNLQFRYESVHFFAARPEETDQYFANLRLMSRVMLFNRYERSFMDQPLASMLAYRPGRALFLYETLGHARGSLDIRVGSEKPMLLRKMHKQLSDTVFKIREYVCAWESIQHDYLEGIGWEEIVKKYKLSENWYGDRGNTCCPSFMGFAYNTMRL